MKKIFTILAVALFLGACHCAQCTKSACQMNKQAKCACAQHKAGAKCQKKEGCKCQEHQGKECPFAKEHKAGCKCHKGKKQGCKKHQGKECPCAKEHKAPAPKPVAAKPAPAPKPVAKKVAEDKDLAAVGKVKTKEDNTAVFSFDKSINFKINSDEIQGNSPKDIKQAAKALKKYPNAKVKVVGYTDSIGDPEYNVGLSLRRAKAVAAQLIKDGVPSDNVTAIGMGANNPIATNKTAEGRAQNRRVELEISNK